MGQYFTYITGVLTFIGFILQVRDVFPAHKEIRKGALLIAFGVFLGSIVGSVDRVQFNIETELHPVNAILIVFLAVLVVGATLLSIFAIITDNSEKRSELYNFVGGISVMFFVVLLATGISFGFSLDKEKKAPLTDREIIQIATHNIDIGNYERAVEYLKKLKSRYSYGDARYINADQEVKRLESIIAKSILGGGSPNKALKLDAQ